VEHVHLEQMRLKILPYNFN